MVYWHPPVLVVHAKSRASGLIERKGRWYLQSVMHERLDNQLQYDKALKVAHCFHQLMRTSFGPEG